MRPRRLAVGLTALCCTLVGPLAAQSAGSGPEEPPSVLRQADSLTGKLQDDVAAGRWDAAERRVSALQRLVPGLDSLEEALAARGVLKGGESSVSDVVDALARRLSGRQRLPALVSANAVVRALLPLLAPFNTPAQQAVVRLDVAGRDLQYAAERGSWGAAHDALGEIQEAYATVQPRLLEHAPDLNATIERRLQELSGALAAHQHVRAHSLAGEFIQDVDLIQSTHAVDH